MSESAGTVNEFMYWQAAITEWHESGDTEQIQQGLRNGMNIPPFAREVIADLLAGRARREPELKNARRLTRDLFIRGNYQDFLRRAKAAKKRGLLRRGETPSDMAIRELAALYALSEDTVHSIVRRKKSV